MEAMVRVADASIEPIMPFAALMDLGMEIGGVALLALHEILGVPDAGIGATGTGRSAPCTDFGVVDAGIGVDDAGIPDVAS